MNTPVSGAEPRLPFTLRLLHYALNQTDDYILTFDPVLDSTAVRITEAGEVRFDLVAADADMRHQRINVLINDDALPQDMLGRWVWQTEHYMGYYDLHVRVGESTTYATRLRVMPEKLSDNSYQIMFDDLRRITFGLLVEVLNKGQLSIDATQWTIDPSPAGLLITLEHAIAQIARIINGLRLSANQNLVRERQVVAGWRVQEIDSQSLAWLVHHPDVLTGSVPERVETGFAHKSSDTYENRFCVRMLQLLSQRATDIEHKAQTEIAQRTQFRDHFIYATQRDRRGQEEAKIAALSAIVDRCRHIHRNIRILGETAFLRGIPPLSQRPQPSQVLQKHPLYRRMYRLYLDLRRDMELRYNDETFLGSVSLKSLPLLYEFWCATQVLAGLQSLGFELEQTDIFTFDIDHSTYTLSFRSGSGVGLRRGAQRIIVYYDRQYPYYGEVVAGQPPLPYGPDRSISVKSRSDFCLEIWQPGEPIPTLVIFDAKYSIDRDSERRDIHSKALGEVAKYRDNFIAFPPTNPVRKIVTSAYALYPGAVLRDDAPNYGGGAIPLVPGEDNADFLELLPKILVRAGISESRRTQDI